MGSVTLPTLAIIAAVGTVATATASAVESHQQGIAAADADKRKANAENLNARQQMITSRQRMLAALASQGAGSLGAVATGGASGFAANANRQIYQQQNDISVINANNSAQISLLDQAASNAESAGNIGAISDIVGGFTKAASILPGRTNPTPPGAPGGS